NYVAFWADPKLAGVDRALFLGHDPYRLLAWLNSMPMAIFYHRGWFALMIVTLLVVLYRPPSPQKSAIMLSYFLLWTIVGPVIHILLPAAGPVFFERLGYGADFSAIRLPDEMVRMKDYLWAYYSKGGFGPGSGISAMPSLHIATTAWMVIAMFVHARRWTLPVAACGALIFLLSISLGWHYAIDGIVGASAAIGCYRLCLRLYAAQPSPASEARRAVAVGASD
ncbi:MAG: phosphatase PAP2 family protein, partial [Sphingomicrobium sp.]